MFFFFLDVGNLALSTLQKNLLFYELAHIKLVCDIWAPYGRLLKAEMLNLDSLRSSS